MNALKPPEAPLKALKALEAGAGVDAGVVLDGFGVLGTPKDGLPNTEVPRAEGVPNFGVVDTPVGT